MTPKIELEREEMRATLDVIKRLEKFPAPAQLRILDASTAYLDPVARITRKRR